MNKIKTRESSKAGADKLTYYRCTGTGSQRKGCGNMVRMEVTDAAVNEIMATTLRILVKGSDHQDELAELARLRAKRDGLKTLPAQPGRWDEQLTGKCTPTSTRRSPPPNAERS